MQNNNYESFLKTLSADVWRKVGIKRRSGVVAPLFSIYSSDSIGIGDIRDLRLLVDWCKKTGMSIIQLLPMNDVGFNFRPYDAQSMFAIDPMYLSLSALLNVDLKPFKTEIKKIKTDFPAGKNRVNYEIKAAKLHLLWKVFAAAPAAGNPQFEMFMEKNEFWLEDYALFKVIKEKNSEMAWEGWSADLKHKDEKTIFAFRETYAENMLFHKWLQWQLYEQFKKAKAYANDQGILIMGDLPFLVSRDSADVWSHQQYFKLGLASGAPPDMLYSKGQRWGMPPYNWRTIESNGYDYLTEKLKFAENFYDLYRIDHVVGIFRVWTIPLSEPLEHAGFNGSFDPIEETLWEDHGKKILSVMVKSSNMLACAEDLGVVPACSYKILNELGIPGIDIQRWMRDWDKTYDFKKPYLYRYNSLATIATHDMSSLCAWWDFEAGTIDEELLIRKCGQKEIQFNALKNKLFDMEHSLHGRLRWRKTISSQDILLSYLNKDITACKEIIDLYNSSYGEREKFLNFLGIEDTADGDYPPLFIKKSLEKISESSSIFSTQLIHDWLSLDSLFDFDPWELRINFPGTLSDKNWSMIIPVALEDMLELPVNDVIKNINKMSDRIYQEGR